MAQTTDRAFLVRPSIFGANPQTADSNSFQSRQSASEDVTTLAQIEFDGLVSSLSSAGVKTTVIQDEPGSGCLDAVFPNNWFSTHEDGTLVLYPMMSELRRRERSRVALTKITESYKVDRLVDLTHFEAEQTFLEGTGSMVLDRVNRVAYACLSPRTHYAALEEFCRRLDYLPVAFQACDASGQDIYHTNVVTSIGSCVALVCFEAVPAVLDRRNLEKRLVASGRQVFDVSLADVARFACNVLELQNLNGSPVYAVSMTALDVPAIQELARTGELVTASIPTIEQYGGGSVRCMIAENFLRLKLGMLDSDVTSMS